MQEQNVQTSPVVVHGSQGDDKRAKTAASGRVEHGKGVATLQAMHGENMQEPDASGVCEQALHAVLEQGQRGRNTQAGLQQQGVRVQTLQVEGHTQLQVSLLHP